MENAIYGGRVDNSYDFIVLKTYLKQYMSDAVLDGRGGKAADRGLNMISPTTNRQEYIRLIESLPDSDSPSMFGLPPNVERSVQRAQSGQVISQLKRLARSMALMGGSSFKFNREQWRVELGPIIELWDRLTKSSRDVLSRPSRGGGGGSGGGGSKSNRDDGADNVLPLMQFVNMESQFAYDIVSVVDTNMKAIKRVVFGSGLLTPQIQSNAGALLSNTVPMAWEKKWEGPENPQAWMKAVVLKKVALAGWSQKVDSLRSGGGGASVSLNLSELFSPGTFLMALRQQTARVARLQMDSLVLSSSFGDELARAPLPVMITGLLLQGATYEDNRLSLSGAGASELCSMNACTLAFVEDTAGDHKKKSGSSGKLDVPLYFSPTREKLLAPISISVGSQSEDWIIAGVALFLNPE